MSLVVGSELDGFVSHVESDAGAQFLKVWIQFDSHLPALIESTLASMKEILNDDAGLIQPQDLKVGDMYLARYVEDNNWYRARIVDISSLSKGSVLVSFVDYGNCESVDVGVIRKVNNDIANHRDQAHMCLLGDVFPVDVSWSVNVLKYCKENLCYEEVLVKITSIINSLPVVRITVRTKQISFNEEIILAGYARSSSSVLNNGVKEGSQAVSKLEKGSRSDSCNYVSRNLPSQQTTVEIYIMHVISATKIWVHFVKDRELHNWDAMKTGIESYYQNVPQKPFEKVTVGMMCIAQSLEKNCFARGLITEKDTKACHVLFMDYGNIEQKLASNLYALPTAYKAVPSLAQQCLVDVSAWSGDPRHIREHLRSLEGSTPVKCYILGKTKNLYHIQLITDYGNSKEFGVPPTYQRVVVEPGQTYAVEVTHIRRPTSFYVQKLDSRPAYQMLFAELQNENKIRSNPLNASSLYPGMPCCVFSNDHWYRGEIVQAPVPGVVSVFFVDIGQKDVVTIGNVTTISPDLIQRLPAQAIECCLQGFESGGQKSKAGVKEMTAMISQRQVTLEVMDVRNDVARVNMYDSHKGGFRLLNLELSVRIEDSQKKIVVPFPEIGDIETIFVTFFESLSNFFGQCVKFSTESLDQLQQQLNLYYGGMNSGECILYADGQSHIGDYCCAPYSLDHQFYRGKVLKKQAEEVTVLFVDFGNKEVVPACDVKILSSRFTHHPQFGVWCCYEDSGSVNMTPQILSGILLNQTVTLEVVRRGENVLHVKISPLHNEPELVKKLTFLNNVGASQEQSLSLPFLQYIDLPLTGDEEEITIVHFKNPLKFWCQLNRLTQDVALVTSLVSDYVQNSSCLEFDVVPSVRSPCLAKYSVDQNWYRGTIMTAPNEKRMVTVYFEDYGNSDMVHVDDLRQISQTLMSFPRLAIECCIANVRVGEFTFDVLHSLEEKILDKPFKVRIMSSQTPLKLEFIDECGKAIIEESGICFKDLKSRNTQQSVNAEFPAASSPDDIMDNDTGWDEDCTSFQEGLQATTSLQQNSSTSTWQSFPIQNDNFSKGDGRQFRNRDTYGARRHNSNESERGRKRSRRSGSDENDRPNSFQGRSYNDNSDGNGYNGQNSYQRGKPYSDRSKFDRKGRNDNNGAYQRFVPPRMQKGKPSYQNNVNDFGKCNSDARDWDNPSTSWDIPAEDWDNPVEKQGFGSSVMNNTVDIPVPSIENGVYKEMVVVHVCTPSEFFCHLVDSIPTLEKSLSDLQSSYSVLNESELAVTNPQVGMICCAKFSEDGEWYRAKVKSINGTVAEVFFVDYGNVDTINTAQIKVLKSEYCTLPMQALKCSLRSALPVGGKWRKEDIDFFESQTLGKEVLCKFIGKREDDNTVYTVRLMDVSFCDDLLVDYVMIKEGHARPVSLNDCVYRSMVSDHVTCPYPEKAIDSGTMETVVVSWLDSPDRFFCQLQTNEEQLTLLEAELNSFYSSCKPLDFILSEPRPYAACVASYGAPAFEAWYRASILAVDDKDAVVLFVDYGNVETVSRQKVLDIKAEYMHIPVQAFKCRLRGVKPVGFKWPKFSKKLLEQYFGGKLECTFQSKDDDGFLSVDLMSSGKSVAKCLVDDRLACGNRQMITLDSTIISDSDLPSKDDDMLNFSKKTECDDNRLNSYRVSSGQRLEVLCSCIVSPNLLFVQKCSDVSAIDEFSDKLNAEYNDLELSYVKTSDDYNVGDFCVTRYSADEKWYRAVILNKLELDGEYEVRFIDFGNSEVVKADTLRKMQPYFEGISPFAVKCALTGLDVIPPEVVPDALYDALNNILQYGELTVVAEFHNLSTDGKFMVKLIIDNTDVASELRRIFDLPLPNDHDKLALGEMLEVFISHVESPSNFWFQRGVDDEEIQILQQKVATYCNDATHDPDFKIDEGAWCLARFSEDTSWYRAKTCLPWDSNGVTVHFLDFGNSEVVGVEDLLQMPDEFLNIPVLGFHGALQGIGNDEWTQDKISQFKEVTGHGGHLLKAKVVAKEGNKYYVTLKYNDVDVIEMLTTNGSQLVDDAIPMQEKNQTEQQGVKFVVGEVFEVLLSHADSPSDFWVQRSSDEATIQQLQSDIDIHCNNIMNSGDMKNDEFSTGSLCLAQFSSDDQWYRAKIINENDNGTVHVRFIDFGNAETVSKSRLLTIPDMFVDLPIFAVNCTLDGFKELRNEQRATETLDRFNELTGHGEFMLNANILEEFDGKYIITLHHDGIDIYQAMMADNMEGNFTPTDDILVNKVAEPDIHFGEKIEVYISHILSPSNFWVQNVTKETEMNELLDKLNSTDTTASASASCDQFVKGKYCVARYSLDERLYRSVILSVDMETKSATVLFIDYGNQECVPLSEIHEISPQFLSVPPFAHPCRLVGLQVPADGTWNDNVIKAFRESVNDGNSTYLAEFIRRDNEIFVLRLLNMGIDVTESMLAVDGVQASDSDNWTTSVVNTTCSKDSLLNSSDKLEIHMEEDVDVDLEPCVSTPNETQMSEEVSDIDLKNDEKSFGPVCDKNISLNVDSLKSTPIEEAQRMLESPLPPGSEEESFKDCNCDELSEPELEIDIARDEELTADGLPYDDEMDVSINPVSVLHSTPVGVIAAERQLCEAEGDSFNSVSHPKAHLHPDDECDNWDRHPVLSFREGPSNDVNMSSELEGNELGHQAESSTAVDPIVNSCSEEAVLGNEDQLHEMTKSEENSVPLMLNVPEDDIGVLSDSDEAMILSPHPDTTTVDQGYSEIGVTGNLSD